MLTFQVSTPVLRAGLIDLDVTWLVQIGLFLLVYAVLAFGFFRPYAARLRRRDEATKGRRETAAAMLAEARAIEQKVDVRLAEARAEAVRIRRELVDEGRAQRDRLVQVERERVQAEVDAALAQLEALLSAQLTQRDRRTRREDEVCVFIHDLDAGPSALRPHHIANTQLHPSHSVQ